MTRRGYIFKPYVTYTVHYSYYSKSRDSWIEGSRVSYAKSVDEAIAEAHDPHTLLIADQEGFHITKVEQTEYGEKKPA